LNIDRSRAVGGSTLTSTVRCYSLTPTFTGLRHVMSRPDGKLLSLQVESQKYISQMY